MEKILSKTLMVLLIVILLLNMSANTIYAAVEVSLNKAYMEKIGEAKQHLKYYREDREKYTYLVCSIVGYYDKQGDFNPSYCMNRDLAGAEDEAYYVTIDSLLDNDEVWRVIKNGYPYKSAKELGLTSKYDAYAVTKWAVYCVLGEAKLKYFKAEKDDEEAVAMLKALKELVDIGKNGTEQQDDNPLSLKKIGSLKEDGEYFSQEYQVESTTEFSSYEVYKTTGMPEGSYIADMDGKEKTIFKSNKNFKIMIPKTQIAEDLNIKVKVKAECKSYIIMEGKTTVTKTQNYVITAGEYATAIASSRLRTVTNTAKIIVNKIAEDTKKPMKGVKFKLYDNDGDLVATKVTDENGKIEFENLYPGIYTLIETKTNAKYILNKSPIEIELEYNETEEIDIENQREKGNLKIYKVDKENNEIRIPGVKFDLYSEEQQKVIGTYTTDENGEIYIKNLPTGTYKVIEKSTNKWYNLADEVKIEVKYNETTETTVENEAKKGQVRVIKVDSENNKTRIEGVKFEVKDKTGKVLETIITDKNGEATTSKYPVKDFEKLYLQEISTKKDYELTEEITEVELETDQIKDVTIENKKKKGNLKIFKIDEENKEIKIEGATFKLYNKESKKLIGTYTTDKNGEISIENLPIGVYTIKEIATNKLYNLEEKEIDIEVIYNETTETTVTNKAKKGQVKVIKVDSENEEIKIEGVKFEVQDKTGKVLETIITDKNGEAVTSKYAIKDYESIYLKEIETNEKYILNSEKFEMKLTANQTEEITIKNEKIKGKIKIVKTSENESKITGAKAGTPLEGVKFEIYDINNNYIETITTNKNGIALTSDLEKGEYKIKEIETNKYYYLNEKTVNITIENNKEIKEVKITNEAKNPEVDIEKSGPDTAEVGSEIQYDISLRNTGNTSLDNFIMTDVIPSEYIKVIKFKTGTYNQDVLYNLYYKTNLSNDNYILLMEDLNSKENYEINFELELADNEYITEIKLEFETIDIGFSSNENPHITATINSTVKSEDTFTNIVKISGKCEDYNVFDQSKWKTMAYKLLPKTGF